MNPNNPAHLTARLTAHQAARTSFRNRLMLTLGPVLSLSLVLMGIFAWLFAYSWLTYSAQAILDVEIREIANQIVSENGEREVDNYYWGEPHHRYDTEHIDPYFLQVFDENGRLIRASDNIRFFASHTYPSRLLPFQAASAPLIQRLRMFRVRERNLYYRTRPFSDPNNRLLGYIQVARYDPGIAATMRRTTYFILGSLGPVLLGLLAIVWWSARSVVTPLELITNEARTLSSSRLDKRITIPDVSDNETALLATALNDLLVRLEQSFEEMQRFTADAAHELQTPLTVLKGHINVALRRDRSTASYKETLRVLLTQTEDLIRLVHNLLQLARLERGDRLLIPQPVDLVSVVREAATHFKKHATEKGLGFEVDLPDNAWIKGQDSFTHEIVANLLENAIKYTDTGSIYASVQVNGETVKLNIKDTGAGMTKEVLKHATDRFYRAPTSSAKEIPGSGLGLALVKQILDREGAQLHIDSSVNEGTEVVITFKPDRSRLA
ncbi:MAG: sensor histidine kinase [Rhodothermales bacterium]